MTNTKKGSVVSFVYKKNIVHAKVVRWSGDPDRRALLVDKNGGVYQYYIGEPHTYEPGQSVKGTVLLPLDEVEQVSEELDVFLASKRGRRVVTTAVSPTIRMTVDPAPGRGRLENYEIPLKLCSGMTSDWSPELERYLVLWCGKYYGLLDNLGSRQREAYWRAIHLEQPRHEIAQEMGMPYGTVCVYVHRARKKIQEALKRDRDIVSAV